MIRIIAANANQRGDLFTRLMSDLFHSLGYEQFRYNVHQTGREVDIIGTHCTEHRMLVAECKAESETIGGGDLNKFYGVLDAERKKAKMPTAGYFASISGFKESAIQQEKDAGDRFTLLNASEVIYHLTRGRIIVDSKDAIAEASKWLTSSSPLKANSVELLAHQSGWHWLITFASRGGSTSNYSVVHADGYVLERSRAKAVADSLTSITNLDFVGPDAQEVNGEVDEARRRYIEYLIKEYGYITLEGLPADQEVGSRSLRLENIFVPLSLEKVAPDIAEEDPQNNPNEADESVDSVLEEFEFSEVTPTGTNSQREPAGKVLAGNSRLALLGSPGSGKTTLLKRLAVAYAAPDRRKASADYLPDRDWFPVAIRCRHLGADVSRPLLKGIEGIAARAEMPELAGAFLECVTRELRAGRVLLLVDGLDEIASPADRSLFVAQLRTFLGTYPSASLVVTSREFGFRTIAGSLASLCTMYRVAELSAQNVRTITLSWHREVVGPSAAVREQAAALAESILKTDRVRRLAVNPLLLTTLLLVRRWLGELPRKRSVLYAKAIEVLLMTWNVEGHQPLDPDEALPQLAFAAFSMMQKNVQTVSVKELTGYFSEARRQMPELLGYSRISVSEFVSRVEERSSLLSLSGYRLEDGQLRATYEFKHLTFQEYLAALAAAQGYYPNRQENERLVDVIEPYLSRPSWREIVPLAGVLGGRSGGALVERIIEKIGPHRDFLSLVEEDDSRLARGDDLNSWRQQESLLSLVARCLADDVPLGPETLSKAINTVITQMRRPPNEEILSGRYGAEIYAAAKTGYLAFDNSVYQYGSVLSHGSVLDGPRIAENLAGFFEPTAKLLGSADPWERIEGCLRTMEAGFTYKSRKVRVNGRSAPAWGKEFSKFKTKIIGLIESEDNPRVFFAACWALCWLVEIKKPTTLQTSRLLSRLWETWRTTENFMLRRQCAWTIWVLPILDRSVITLSAGTSGEEFLKAELDSGLWQKKEHYRAAMTIGYYLRFPWTDEDLLKIAQAKWEAEQHVSAEDRSWWLQFVGSFGQRGATVIRAMESGKERQPAVRKRSPRA